MKIQVLGSNCPNCKKMYSSVCRIATDLKIKDAIEYINDLQVMIKIGLMTTPALLINNELVLIGSHHSDEEISKALTQSLKKTDEDIPSNQGLSCSSCSVI